MFSLICGLEVRLDEVTTKDSFRLCLGNSMDIIFSKLEKEMACFIEAKWKETFARLSLPITARLTKIGFSVKAKKR